MKKLLGLPMAIIACAWITHSYSQVVQEHLWITNGTVNAIAVDANRIYLGGDFDYAGPNTPYGASVSLSTGKPDLNFPLIDGATTPIVYVSVPDGAGGWYIGGDFDEVGGLPRKNAARINADGSVHHWNPNVQGVVYDLARYDGKIIIGGAFTHVNSIGRVNLAIVDETDGFLTATNPPSPNTRVNCVHVNGDILYIGGSFASVGGVGRNRIAAIDLLTATLTSWNPSITGGTEVYDIASFGTKIYVGGSFSTVGSDSRANLAAIDAATGVATAWSPNPNSNVQAVVENSGILYVGGPFGAIAGLASRQYVASFDANTDVITSWDPNPNLSVTEIEVDANNIYLAGSFYTIAGSSRNHLASFNKVTLALNAWNPNPEGVGLVESITSDGTNLYVGGTFKSIGGVDRNYFVALNKVTGEADSWNPNPNNIVYSLLVNGTTLYVAGAFNTINGVAKPELASIDLLTNTVNAGFTANLAGGFINSMVLDGSNLYIGGSFTSVNSTTANRLAAVNSSTGVLDATFNPSVNSTVLSIALHSGTIYLGGSFATVNGLARTNLTAVDATNGDDIGWAPNPDNQVRALTIYNNVLYLGGSFGNVETTSRMRLAAYDLPSRSLNAWSPDINSGGAVHSLHGTSDVMIVGGSFTTIDLVPRNRLASVGVNSGSVYSWDPNVNNIVNTIVSYGSDVYVGGQFLKVGDDPRFHFAGFSLASVLPVKLLSFSAIRDYNSNTVRCNWSTTEERHVSKFIVERSNDARTYSPIGTISAVGNSSTVQSYQFTDPNPVKGTGYYRLKMIDDDGSFDYSRVVAVHSERDKHIVMFYPNPAQDKATLMISSPNKEKINYSVYDASGKLVASRHVQLDEGSNLIDVNLATLPAGWYSLRVNGASIRKSVSFIRQ